MFSRTDCWTNPTNPSSPYLTHKQEVMNLVESQHLAEKIWHLCEIFFLQSDWLSQPLLSDWIQSHFPISGMLIEPKALDIKVTTCCIDIDETDDVMVHRLCEAQHPEEGEDYWPTLYRFALRGLPELVAALLERHTLHPRRGEQRTVTKIGDMLAMLTVCQENPF